MSMILDALNRSRNEVDSVPGLDTQPIYLEAPRAGVRRWAPWAALGLAALVIAWLVWDRSRVADPVIADAVVADAVVAKAPSAPVAQPGPAVAVPEPAVAPKPAVAAANAEQKVSSPAPEKPVRGERNAVNQAAVAKLYETPEPAPAPATEVAPRPAQAPPTSSRQPEPDTATDSEPVDVEQMLQMARREMRNAEVEIEEHPAPLVSALSQHEKDAIPTLLYERHDYNSAPGRSSVVINGKTVRAGGSVGGGVRVEEILENSVVLTHRDTQFRLRALNSWVNL